MFKLIIVIIFSTFLNAEEIPHVEKPVDLNKIVHMYIREGVPGYTSPDGSVFTTVHGFKYVKSDAKPLFAHPADVPFWLSKRPSKVVQDAMTPEQLEFWKAVTEEAAITAPLANKEAKLHETYNSAVAARMNLAEAINKEIIKASGSADKSLRGPSADQARNNRLVSADDAVKKAAEAIVEFDKTTAPQDLLASEARLRAIWKTKLP